MDIVTRMQHSLPVLSQAEQKIARFILDDIAYAAQAPIHELAEKSGVSHASITRLSRALKCKNVREMKMLLAQSLAVGQRFLNEQPVEKKASTAVYQAIHELLEINAGLISDKNIDDACNAILAAKQTLVFGVGGGSTIMAQECHHRMFRLSINTHAYSDPLLMRMTAATADEQDVVLCLSLSGYSPDVEAAVEIAKEYGATVIGICPVGTLANLCDIYLPIEGREDEYIFMPSVSRYVMLAAIDILVSELAVRNQDNSREKLRRIKHHLDQHRKGPNRLPLGD